MLGCPRLFVLLCLRLRSRYQSQRRSNVAWQVNEERTNLDFYWLLIAFERIIKYYKISEGIAKNL